MKKRTIIYNRAGLLIAKRRMFTWKDIEWLRRAGFTETTYRHDTYVLDDPVYGQTLYIFRNMGTRPSVFGTVTPLRMDTEAFASGKTAKEVYEKLKGLLLKHMGAGR